MKRYLFGFIIGLSLAASLAAAGAIWKIPAGITPDNLGYGGLYGLANAINNYAESISAVTTSGTNTTLTPAQVLAGVTKLNAGASGGFTITLPSTASIIGGMGCCIPLDGTYSEPISMENNAVGQTGTLTAGDASTTLTGTMTVATNTRRVFIMTITSASTITIENIGTMGL
jgi:hypothetical protein